MQKLSWFLLLSLLFLSSLLYSEITDEQAQEILKESQNISQKLDENETLLNSMEVSQNSSIETTKILQNNSEIVSKNNEAKDKSYEKIIEVQENQITELKKSSITQRVHDFFIGVLTAFSTTFIISIFYLTNV